MQLQVAERQDAVVQDAATQENTRRLTIRLAAGVVDTIGLRTPEGRHFGRLVCVDCPRVGHVPPYLPFGLESHTREHLERHPGHQILYYCFDHCEFEDDGDLRAERRAGELLGDGKETQGKALPAPAQEVNETDRVRFRLLASHRPLVLAAVEVLEAAGYHVLPPEAPPEPPKLVLMWGEARVLRIVRERPGISAPAIAQTLHLQRHTITQLLGLLAKGGHVRHERARGVQGGLHYWSPVGDRPIGRVEPRGKANWHREALAG